MPYVVRSVVDKLVRLAKPNQIRNNHPQTFKLENNVGIIIHFLNKYFFNELFCTKISLTPFTVTSFFFMPPSNFCKYFILIINILPESSVCEGWNYFLEVEWPEWLTMQQNFTIITYFIGFLFAWSILLVQIQGFVYIFYIFIKQTI